MLDTTRLWRARAALQRFWHDAAAGKFHSEFTMSPLELLKHKDLP